MDYKHLANLLFPDVTTTPDELEERYPQRNLPEGAKVTRFAPSPTGYVHLGGVFFLRIEDTDAKREIPGAAQNLINTLARYGIKFDEGATVDENANIVDNGAYGPYKQSERAAIYHVYAKKLVEEGKAYPCFTTDEELAVLEATDKKAKKAEKIEKAEKVEKAEKAEDSKVDDQLIKAVCEKIEGEIPEVMFENEAENCIRDYENRLRYQGMDLETFMKYTGQTLETLKTQFRPQAEQTVKTRLALEYIAKAEGITATEEDIETEYQKIAEAYGIEIEKVKASIDSAAIAGDVCVGKAVLVLREYAVITVNEGESNVVEVEPEVVSAE